MKQHHAQKQITAGFLTLALVTGGMPVNLGAFPTFGTEIAAHAASYLTFKG